MSLLIDNVSVYVSRGNKQQLDSNLWAAGCNSGERISVAQRHADEVRMIIGISGGTGSGKTTIARKIISAVGEDKAVHLSQDLYYRDLGSLPATERSQINFDHPEAFDNDLLLSHVEALRNGKSIHSPIYDFAAHFRRPETQLKNPLPIIVVEGILIFHDPRMRSFMDLLIFVECDPDIRLIRRLERDIRERGRSPQSVISQYLSTVRPMHEQFIAPSKQYADIVLCSDNSAALEHVIRVIQWQAHKVLRPAG